MESDQQKEEAKVVEVEKTDIEEKKTEKSDAEPSKEHKDVEDKEPEKKDYSEKKEEHSEDKKEEKKEETKEEPKSEEKQVEEKKDEESKTKEEPKSAEDDTKEEKKDEKDNKEKKDKEDEEPTAISKSDSKSEADAEKPESPSNEKKGIDRNDRKKTREANQTSPKALRPKDTLRRFFFKEKTPSEVAKEEGTEAPPKKEEPTPEEEEKQKLNENDFNEAVKKLHEEEPSKAIAERLQVPEGEAPLSAKEIVPDLVNIMKDNKENPSLVINGLQTIRLMADKDGIKYLFRDAQGLPFLIECMKSSNDNVRRTAVRFLGDLLTKNRTNDNVANAEAWIEAEGLPSTIKLLEDKAEVALMAAGVIRVIATFETRATTSFQEAIRTADGLKPFIDLMQSENTDMVKQSANAVRYLTNGNAENRQFYVDNGLIKVIIQQLEKYKEEDNTQLTLLAALSAVSGNEQASKELGSKESMGRLEKILQSESSAELKIGVLHVFHNMCAGPNERAQTALRKDGILVEVLKLLSTENPSLLRSVCITLASMLTANADNATAAEEKEALTKLIELSNLAQPDNVLGPILDCIRAYVAVKPDSQATLLEHHVIAHCIKLIDHTYVEVHEAAMEILRLCRANEKVRHLLAENISKLIDRLYAPVSLLSLESIIFCMESALQDETGRTSFLKPKSNGVENIVKTLDCPRETVVMRACAIMDKLISGNAKNQDAFTKAGAPVKLVALLAHPSQRVRQHSAYAIWALSNLNESGQKAMYRAKAVAALVPLMIKEDSTNILKEYCAGAICALTQDDSSNKKALLAAEGYAALLPLLQAPSDPVASAAAKAIWASTESNTANQNAAKTTIEPLKNLLRSKSILVQASSASALWSLNQNNITNQNATLEAGAIRELVDIINQHAKDYVDKPKENVEKGQALLAAIGTLNTVTSKNEACKKEATDCGGARAVEVLSGVTDRHLTKEREGLLQNLGKIQRTRSRAGSFFASFFEKDAQKEESPKNKRKEDGEKKDEPVPSPTEGKKEEEKSPEEKPKKEKKEDEKPKEEKPKEEKPKEEKPKEEKPKKEKKEKREKEEPKEVKKEEPKEVKKEEPKEVKKEEPTSDAKVDVNAEEKKDATAEEPKKKEKKEKRERKDDGSSPKKPREKKERGEEKKEEGADGTASPRKSRSKREKGEASADGAEKAVKKEKKERKVKASESKEEKSESGDKKEEKTEEKKEEEK